MIKSTAKSIGFVFIYTMLNSLLALALTPLGVNILLASVIAIIPAVTVMTLWYTRKDRKMLSREDVSIPWAIITFLLGLGMWFLVTILSIFIPNGGENSSSVDTISNYNNQFQFLITFIYPVLIAPIAEELIFRGGIGKMFGIQNEFHTKANGDVEIIPAASKKQKICYVLVSSIIFGLMHIGSNVSPIVNIYTFFSTGLTGALFAVMYLKKQNILIPIIAHIAFNIPSSTIITFFM